MDSFLRRATPLVLLVMAALAWFEKWLPGHAALAESFGENAVLRFVTGLLCIYMVMLVLERQRMEMTFKQVLSAFRDFRTGAGAAAGAAGAAAAPGAAEAEREAVSILIAALESGDSAVRANAAAHLQRLTGLDHGEDAAAWRGWLSQRGGSASE